MTTYRIDIRWLGGSFSTWLTRHPENALKEAWCSDHGCPQAESVTITRLPEEEITWEENT